MSKAGSSTCGGLALWGQVTMALLLFGCGGSEPQRSVVLGKSVTGIQCEAPKTTLKQLDEEATQLGLELRSTSCAWDGLLYAAVCGGGSSYIRVIEIPANQTGTARSLGYRVPADFYMFVPSGCPTQ